MNEHILVELKKMTAYLEAIDWKLWNLHKKYVDGMITVEDVKKQLAEVTGQTVEPAAEVVGEPKSTAVAVTPAPVTQAVEETKPAVPKLSPVEEPQEYEYDLDIKPLATPASTKEVSKEENKLVIPKYPTVEKL